VADLFATALYTGDGTAPRAIGGVDLAGDGLCWTKSRSASQQGTLEYQVGGAIPKRWANAAHTTAPVTFGASGVTLTDATNNVSARTYVAWMLRKYVQFVDVVSYTGNGGATLQTVNHNLGVAPAMILVLRTDLSGIFIYHRDVGAASTLNQGTAVAAAGSEWGSTSPTTTQFTVSSSNANALGASYVAILLAHAPAGFVQGFSYTGNGSASGPTVNLGWDPQFVLIKRATGGSAPWAIFDTARSPGFTGADLSLSPFTTFAESSAAVLDAVANGFQIVTTSTSYNASGSQYVGLAIRAP
jgi:hypothetical protein